MSNPQSLSAKVLKARYFPSSDVLGASLGHNPSYTWRNIFHGIEMLKKGVIHKIGSGLNVNIWEDPWLADSVDPKIQTSCPLNCQFRWASDLLMDNGL